MLNVTVSTANTLLGWACVISKDCYTKESNKSVISVLYITLLLLYLFNADFYSFTSQDGIITRQVVKMCMCACKCKNCCLCLYSVNECLMKLVCQTLSSQWFSNHVDILLSGVNFAEMNINKSHQKIHITNILCLRR